MDVLRGVDDGEDAVRALERTVRRAATAGDGVTVAIVDADGSEYATERRVREALADAGVDADVRHVEAGSAGSELVRMAEEEGFDEIVLGGGERSPMGKIRLDELREFVVLNADVTVTLVR
jgi:nucleotide-binding universal stress UspA family protein